MGCLFGNYLRNLQEYGELGAAKKIFNRYFSYAVALGVAEDMLDYADRLGWEPPSLDAGAGPYPSSSTRRFPDPVGNMAGADGRPQRLPGRGIVPGSLRVPVAEPGRRIIWRACPATGSSLSPACRQGWAHSLPPPPAMAAAAPRSASRVSRRSAR